MPDFTPSRRTPRLRSPPVGRRRCNRESRSPETRCRRETRRGPMPDVVRLRRRARECPTSYCGFWRDQRNSRVRTGAPSMSSTSSSASLRLGGQVLVAGIESLRIATAPEERANERASVRRTPRPLRSDPRGRQQRDFARDVARRILSRAWGDGSGRAGTRTPRLPWTRMASCRRARPASCRGRAAGRQRRRPGRRVPPLAPAKRPACESTHEHCRPRRRCSVRA